MNNDIALIQSLQEASRGEVPVDYKFINGKVINVYNGSITADVVAVHAGHIVGFGDYESKNIIDLRGKYLAPGLIDGHIHIESSKLSPGQFAETVAVHGTTTVVADPHEIANVLGIEGILYMIRESSQLKVDIFYMLPSCVPATDMETSGAILSADDLKPLLEEDNVLGIGEIMNFPGAYYGDPEVLRKTTLGGKFGMVDGHAPGLTGKYLSSYIISGPGTDHECSTLDEAKEKLKKGMRIMIREGSSAKNLECLLSLITPANERRCMFVSDDRNAGDLVNEGHLNLVLRQAVKLGLDPVTSIRMVTLNTSETFRLSDRGGIKPGNIADFTVFDDLQEFNVNSVWKNGSILYQQDSQPKTNSSVSVSIATQPLNVPQFTLEMLSVEDRSCKVNVIDIIPDQITTGASIVDLPSEAGTLCTDSTHDICKLIVIERYSGDGNYAMGFVRGLGLMTGALGSTVAHDSHNIIVAGMDDLSMITAANLLIECGGGQVVTAGDKILSKLQLPIAGLMTNTSASDVVKSENSLLDACRDLGVKLRDPFMTLSFLSLPVIPKLKLTDRGYVDVDDFKLIPLYV